MGRALPIASAAMIAEPWLTGDIAHPATGLHNAQIAGTKTRLRVLLRRPN